MRNTTGNSRPFAECSVISVTELTSGIVLVEVGDERDRFEERLHAVEALGAADASSPWPTPPIATSPCEVALVDLLVELARRADELLQVLDAALRLDRAFGFELGEVAALRQHRFERGADTLRAFLLDSTPSGRADRATRRAPCR